MNAGKNDVIADLQRVTPYRSFSDYPALLRAYISQGLRVDLENLEGQPDISTTLLIV